MPEMYEIIFTFRFDGSERRVFIEDNGYAFPYYNAIVSDAKVKASKFLACSIWDLRFKSLRVI